MASPLGNRAIGLELDTGTARAVELTGKSGSPGLAAMGSIDLPDEAVKEGMVLQPEEVGKALKILWNKAGFKGRDVILGVSNQGVLVRHITVPKVPPAKLKNVVTFQAQEHLPIALNSVVLDYLVLGDAPPTEESGANLEILLVAARKDMLDMFLQALKMAKLEPLDVDVSSMTMVRLLPQQALGMNIALVNISNGLNNFLVSAQGKPRLARLGMVKVKDLAEDLESSIEGLISGQVLNTEGADDLLTNWTNNLASEIRSSLTYYQDQPGASMVEGVLLSGRGALLAGIEEKLENNLDLPVRKLNYLEEYNPAKRKFVNLNEEAVEYAISTGLALRGLEG